MDEEKGPGQEPGHPMLSHLRTVPKPKTEELIKIQVCKQLAEVHSLAAQGEVSGVFMLVQHPDGTYSEVASATLAFTQLIGQLEIVKQDLVKRYLAEAQRGGPKG